MKNKNEIRGALRILVAGTFLVLYVSSCKENDNLDYTKPTLTSEDLKRGLKSSTITEADLLKSGWTLVKDIKSPFYTENTDGRPKTGQKNGATSGDQEISLTANHLSQLGYDVSNPKTILEGFVYGSIRPDGVNFNSQLKVGSVSDQQTGNAYVLLGSPSIKVLSDDLEMPDEVYVSEVENNSAETITLSKKYTYKQGYKTTWQRKVSGSLKIGAKVTIGLPADVVKGEVSTEITVGGETTDGTEDSTEKSIEDAVSVPVPPHSKVKVVIMTKIKKTTVNYSVPMSVKGRAWANYYKTVNGHYFWGLPASGIDSDGTSSYKLTHGKLTAESGEVSKISNVETKTFIGPSEPLK